MAARQKINRFAPKLHIKTGDTVLVIAGASNGVKGQVLQVFPKENKAIVAGAGIVKKHRKPTDATPEGGIVEMEAPIHVSNLMLVDPATGEATKIGRKVVDGKIVRYSKKTGEIIK